MDYHEKLFLRTERLEQLALEGKATSRDLLKADFGYDLLDGQPHPDINIDRNIEIRPFRKSLVGSFCEAARGHLASAFSSKNALYAGLHIAPPAILMGAATALSQLYFEGPSPAFAAGFGAVLGANIYNLKLFFSNATNHRQSSLKSEGFFIPRMPHRLFIRDNELRSGDPYHLECATTTLSHEHIHHLQFQADMPQDLRSADKTRFKSHLVNPRSKLATLSYLATEVEIMPRLHDLLSTFVLMGGKLPETEVEFKKFAGWSLGKTMERIAHLPVEDKGLKDIMPRMDYNERKAFRYDFDTTVYKSQLELRRVIEALQDRSFCYDFMRESYMNLLDLYGLPGTREDFVQNPAMPHP